jgi:methionine sulfoxide reductase heme-binding subunit
MQPATGPLKQPLGGTSGKWRYRLLRFHLPIALASAVIIFLWMSLPMFQAADHQAPRTDGQTGAHQGKSPMGGHQGSAQGGGHQGSTQAGDHQASPPAAHTTPPMDQRREPDINPDERQTHLLVGRFTTATGYVALGLLALTLLIGPANLLLRRRNPVSSYLRRDVGAWTAIVSVIHVIAGLFVHGSPAPLGERLVRYFFAPDGSLLTNPFGLANWTGLAATVIVVGLLTISSNFALRKLKAGPWKWLQRLNYGLFVLVILHAIYYGALLRVTSPSTLLLGLTVSAVFVGQVVGITLWRRQYAVSARG